MIVFAEIPVSLSAAVVNRDGAAVRAQPNQGGAAIDRIRKVWLRQTGRSAKMVEHHRAASAKVVGRFGTARRVNRSGQGK